MHGALAVIHHHHGRGGLVVLGIILIVIGAIQFTFRRGLGRFNQRVQQARHDAAPRGLKMLFPNPGPWYYRTVGPMIGLAFVVAGLVLVIVH